jgi:hypothetical protein
MAGDHFAVPVGSGHLEVVYIRLVNPEAIQMSCRSFRLGHARVGLPHNRNSAARRGLEIATDIVP